MKRITPAALFLLLAMVLPCPAGAGEECTIGVASGKATADGRPLLWKNRDIPLKYTNNDIRFEKGERFNYLALKTVGYPEYAWAGANSEGFCVLNATSSDLAGSSREGLGNGEFIKRALGRCASVAEFEELLQRSNWPGRRTNASFAAIDASGAAAIFETRNYSYTKFNANDPEVAPEGYIVRANFALTSDGNGGELRHRRADELWQRAVEGGELDHAYVLQKVARDLADAEGNAYDLPVTATVNSEHPYSIETYDTVNRSTTSAAIVFTGVKDGEDASLTTMWSALGQPIFTIASPAWVVSGGSPEALHGENGSAIRTQAARLFDAHYVSGFEDGKTRYYLSTLGMPALIADLGAAEDQVFDSTEAFLESSRQTGAMDAAAAREFQDRAGRLALSEIERIAGRVLEARPLKVGVYADGGASPVCVTETMAALEIDPGIVPIALTAVDLMLGVLDRLDVMVFPGGSGSKQASSMGGQGKERVRRFVLEEGKGCVGICAGGYLLSNGPYKSSLKLISADVFDRAHYNRGRGLMEVAFTADGRRLFPEIAAGARTFLQYNEGPVLVRSENTDLPPYEELATYVSDIHLDGGAEPGVTPGKTAMLMNAAGKGKVAVCVGHPESTPGMRWIVPRMARMVAGRMPISYTAEVVRPDRETREILVDEQWADEERRLFWQLVGDDTEEKAAALRRLVQMRSRPALRWAEGLLRDNDPAVRLLAAEVLVEAEYTPALDDLEAAVRVEGNEHLREALKENLETLEKIVAAR